MKIKKGYIWCLFIMLILLLGSSTKSFALDTIQFSSSTYSEVEDVGNATITVTRTGTGAGAAAVCYSSSDGSATDGEDYYGVDACLDWEDGVTGDQTFTITIEDDGIDEDAETVSLSLDSPENATLGTNSATLTITDNDDPPIVSFSSATSGNDESVTNPTIEVSLSNFSGKMVTVNYAVSPVSAGTATGGGVDYTLNSGTLTFDPGADTQNISFTVVSDSKDEDDETIIVDLSSPSNATLGATTSHTYEIYDDDEPPDVNIDDVTVIEGNSGTVSAIFTVTLSTASDRTVTVDYSTADDSAESADNDYVAVLSDTITFVPGDTSETITITINGDFRDEGTSEVFFVYLDDTTNGNIVDGVGEGTITDDDTAGVLITESGGSTSITEAGATDSYTVVLLSQPTDDVVITITPDAQVNTDKAVLTFTSGDWNIAQTVTVTAIDDDVYEESHIGTITHTTSSLDFDYDDISVNSVNANITDNDSRGVSIVQTGGSTDVTENGATDTYTIVLTSEPTDLVTVYLINSDGQVVIPDYVEFTSNDWNIPQTVTVAAEDDDVAEGNHSGLIVHSTDSLDPFYDSLTGIDSVTVNIVDNDSAGISVNQDGSVSVYEEEDTDYYYIVLTSEPTATVTITISHDSQLAVSPETIIFTPSNWANDQTIAVSPINDYLIEGSPHNSTLTHSAVSSDPNYNGITIADVVVSITDDDSPGINVSESDGRTNVKEGGITDTYFISLTSQPVADVIITILHDDQVSIDPKSVIFTPDDWNIQHQITVTAVDDELEEGTPHHSTINHSADSDDSNYSGLTDISSVTVEITDNDIPGISIEESDGITQVTEGGEIDSYTATLLVKPIANVLITIRYNELQLVVEPNELIFTPDNWNVPQTVVVEAIDDVESEFNPHNTIIIHNMQSEDLRYADLGSIGRIVVSIIENDEVLDSSDFIDKLSKDEPEEGVSCFNISGNNNRNNALWIVLPMLLLCIIRALNNTLLKIKKK